MGLLQKSIEFVTEDLVYHPLLLFIQIACLHIFRQTGLEGTLLALALIATASKQTNYFWYVGIFIMSGSSYVYLLNFIFGMLSANEPWKLIIFVYLVGDSYLLDTKEQWINYNAACLALLSIYFVLCLPINSHRDNIWYFCGFFSLFILHFIKWLTCHFGFLDSDSTIVLCVMAGIALLSSIKIISHRLHEVSNYSLDEIHSIQNFQIFMESLKKKLNSGIQSCGFEKEHLKECCYVDCFCRRPYQHTTFGDMLIRQHYEWSLKKFDKGDQHEKAKQNVVWNYLQQKQLPLAIESYLKLGSYGLNFFHLTRKQQLKREIYRQHHIIQKSYTIKQRFENAFDYEFNYEILKRSLMELITLKQSFWMEVNRPTSRLSQLMQISRQILQKFNQMHYFFLEKVNRLQTQINVYNGSILYNLFLLQATNYHNMAEVNMKNIRKINGSSEVVRDSRSFFVKVSMKTETMLQIEMATANLTKIIASSRDKSAYIGKSMMFLVPECYSVEHQRGFRQLHGYNFNNLLGINVNPIFFLDSFGYIKTCNVVVKYSTDIENELSIIGHVKLLNDDNDYILVDQDGKILEKTNEKVEIKLLQFDEIKSCIGIFKKNWVDVGQVGQTYPVIQSMKRQIRLNDCYYTCVVNSPFAGSFRFPRVPPIHIAIHNETQNYFPSVDSSDDEEVKGCMNKINALVERDENASRCTTSTHGTYHASIIKKVEEIKIPSIFNKYIFYLSCITFLLCGFSIRNYLSYDDQSSQCDEFQLMLSLYKVEYLIAKSVSRSLTVSAIRAQQINETEYSRIYDTANYTLSAYQFFKKTAFTLRTLILEDIMWKNVDNSYNRQRNSYIKVTSSKATHYMTVAGLISKSFSDIIQLSNRIPFEQVVLSGIYWEHTMPVMRKLIRTLIQSINQHMEKEQTTSYFNIGVQLFVVVLLSLLIFVINRRISNLEITVFQLIISIHEQFVNEELEDLKDLYSNMRCSQNNLNTTMKSSNTIIENSEDREYRRDDAVLNSVASEGGRKRVGQLDLKGYKQRGSPIFIIMLVGIASILSAFLFDRAAIQKTRKAVAFEVSINEWSNGRTILQAALKSISSNKKQLSSFVTQQIKIRKNMSKNNLLTETIQCRHPYLCNHNPSELSLNMFIEQLIGQLLINNHSIKTALLQEASDICDRIHRERSSKRRIEYEQERKETSEIQKTIMIVSIVSQIVLLLLGIAYIEWIKIEFRKATMVMTLMNEPMINNNKRIDSYLQRLNKVV